MSDRHTISRLTAGTWCWKLATARDAAFGSLRSTGDGLIDALPGWKAIARCSVRTVRSCSAPGKQNMASPTGFTRTERVYVGYPRRLSDHPV
jgi:hypothetical protein